MRWHNCIDRTRRDRLAHTWLCSENLFPKIPLFSCRVFRSMQSAWPGVASLPHSYIYAAELRADWLAARVGLDSPRSDGIKGRSEARCLLLMVGGGRGRRMIDWEQDG